MLFPVFVYEPLARQSGEVVPEFEGTRQRGARNGEHFLQRDLHAFISGSGLLAAPDAQYHAVRTGGVEFDIARKGSEP